MACGIDVLAQAREQVARRLVLRRGLRDREDRRHLAVLRSAWRARPWPCRACSATAFCSFVELRLVLGAALRDVDGEQERAVGARPERLAEAVVGDALGLALGLVAVVGLAEAQLRDRRGEHEQDQHAGGDREPRPRGDALAPAAERTATAATCSGFFGRRASGRARRS